MVLVVVWKSDANNHEDDSGGAAADNVRLKMTRDEHTRKKSRRSRNAREFVALSIQSIHSYYKAN